MVAESRLAKEQPHPSPPLRAGEGAKADAPCPSSVCKLQARGCPSPLLRSGKQSSKAKRPPRRMAFCLFELVGGTRIELVTPSMSRKCSTAELTARFASVALASSELYGSGGRTTTSRRCRSWIAGPGRLRPMSEPIQDLSSAATVRVTDGFDRAAEPRPQTPGFARVCTSAPRVSSACPPPAVG